ncbi:MAG: hypothetical protein CUN49_05195 [Candidatus Thermofonsia Clade 1 bacterium]|uniref:Uncharacterized protein n=1 Tax=Candidatus Thermofonsia Clade 1 bacterium TaxID=2364210 RepID=A0A2M8PZB2_9CHLR|nr:MAG: hypothetical protein CUN49_05195 [Candidatus Thermofonsia Clade 1 bacterium]PJF42863.1 MAG: hypothetical protein CUN50_02385 [Candidatus Thermofonsia Clade 1 bacterium]
MDAADRQLAQRERRYRLVLFSGIALLLAIALGICASFAAVAPSVWRPFNGATRIVIQITGEVTRIGGMPMPADAVLRSHTIRESGGIFEYTTQHSAEELFRFYYYLMVQVNGWRIGSQPLVSTDRAEFRFYLNNLPRLTIIKARCADGRCYVSVDY